MGKNIEIKAKHFRNAFIVFLFIASFTVFNLLDVKIPNYFKNNQLDLKEDISINSSDFILGDVVNIEDNFSNISFSHWPHLPITYSFSGFNKPRQINLTRYAFERITYETSGIVRFKEVESEADITIYFKDRIYENGEFSDTLAEATILERSEDNNLILKGKIDFYGQGFTCNTGYPDLEVHEILHLFDFPHSPLSNSIMSTYSAETSRKCNTKNIDEDYISCLKHVYSNGLVAGDCDFENVVYSPEEYSGCEDGWFKVEGMEYCCPEEGMKIINGYCV